MECEFSDGTIWTVSDAAALEGRIRALRDGDHIILSQDDSFVQAAAGGGTFELQYGDGTSLTTAGDGLSVDRVVAAFVEFYEGNRGAGSPPNTEPATASDESVPRSQTEDRGGRSFAEQLVNDAKGVLQNKARRAIRNGLRRFLG